MKQAKRHGKVILPPKPARRAPEAEPEETKTESAKEFLDRIVRKGKGVWLRTFAVWPQDITRAEAKEWLEHVDEEHQRTVTDDCVKRYASDVNSDLYVDGIPMLIFDHKARLINGQHMLRAFIESTADTLAVTVQVNLDPRAYQVADQNKKRSLRDAFKFDGVDRAGDVAGVCTPFHQWKQGFYAGKGYLSARGGSKFLTIGGGERLREEYPNINMHLWPSPVPNAGFSLPAIRAASLAIYLVDDSKDHDYWRRFFEALIKGFHIYDDADPVAVLRNALLAQAGAGRDSWRHGPTMLRVFKAWNYWLRQEEIPGPLYRKGEAFQNPSAPSDFAPMPDAPRPSKRVH